ncbi:family A G protein-coupled receptor-like protein [Xylariaceae sp. FL0662B]|nr:family A G protein-coupled receptor-like protein [Xylariaceae sp. FL0662B]
MGIAWSRANDALTLHPPLADENLTTNGSNWLWAVTAIYIVSFLTVFAFSFFARAGEKVFHYLFTVALFAGSVSYYTIASGLGSLPLPVVNQKPIPEWTRQTFYPEYINWVVSFAILVIALGLLSGISWTTIVFHVILAWVWVLTYLLTVITSTNYRWGYYAFGTLAWAILAFQTLHFGLESARRVEVSRDYILLAGWINFLWLIYPIAVGVSDGSNTIGVTPGYIFFGILDILVVPVVAFAFLIFSRSWDYGKLNLAFTQYGRVAQAGTFPEKSTTPVAAPVVGDQAA